MFRVAVFREAGIEYPLVAHALFSLKHKVFIPAGVSILFVKFPNLLKVPSGFFGKVNHPHASRRFCVWDYHISISFQASVRSFALLFYHHLVDRKVVSLYIAVA